MNRTKYAVVIEKGATSYGAYVPDLPGCVAVAKTKQEVEKLIAEAIAFHIAGLLEKATQYRLPARKLNTLSLPQWPRLGFRADDLADLESA
jgi:predicted RNase H-like HicB family nuclease